jgi:hypothetical protein
MFKPDHLIIHCSATKDSGTVSWPAIRRFHKVECVWSDIGYHFGVEYVGEDVEILMGRMPNVPGAHCSGHNHDSLGVCVVGDYDVYPPSALIWSKAIELARWICAEFAIPMNKVHGHREFNPHKTCPGLKFDMDKFRYELKGGTGWPQS